MKKAYALSVFLGILITITHAGATETPTTSDTLIKMYLEDGTIAYYGFGAKKDTDKKSRDNEKNENVLNSLEIGQQTLHATIDNYSTHEEWANVYQKQYESLKTKLNALWSRAEVSDNLTTEQLTEADKLVEEYLETPSDPIIDPGIVTLLGTFGNRYTSLLNTLGFLGGNSRLDFMFLNAYIGSSDSAPLEDRPTDLQKHEAIQRLTDYVLQSYEKEENLIFSETKEEIKRLDPTAWQTIIDKVPNAFPSCLSEISCRTLKVEPKLIHPDG